MANPNPIDTRDAELKFKTCYKHADQARNSIVIGVGTLEANFINPSDDNRPLGEDPDWQSIKLQIRILYQHLGIIPPV